MTLDPTPTVGVSTGRMPTWLIVVEGVAAIVIGFFFFFQPVQTSLMAAVLLAGYWLVRALLSLIGMMWDRDMWGWKLFLGIFGVVAALLILQGPITGAAQVAMVFMIVLGVYGVIVGTLETYLGFEHRNSSQASIGAVSFLLGFLLLLHPVISAMALMWSAGAIAVIGGAITLWSAYATGEERERTHPEAMKPA